MGINESKDNTAIAQAQVVPGHLDNKINNFGIVLIVIAVLLSVILCYGMRIHCHRKIRNWLKKEMTVGHVNPPVVRIQTVQQQPATNATDTAGYI